MRDLDRSTYGECPVCGRTVLCWWSNYHRCFYVGTHYPDTTPLPCEGRDTPISFNVNFFSTRTVTDL